MAVGSQSVQSVGQFAVELLVAAAAIGSRQFGIYSGVVGGGRGGSGCGGSFSRSVELGSHAVPAVAVAVAVVGLLAA